MLHSPERDGRNAESGVGHRDAGPDRCSRCADDGLADVHAASVWLGGASWAWLHTIKTLRRTIMLPRIPFFEGIAPNANMYFKPGLHPDDVDHSEILETWRGNIWVDWPIARAPVADNCDPLSLSALGVLHWQVVNA
ncbi:hypothetical protein NJB1507_43860 [Mycobacterium marinum]|nr:hypothetical protein NJB1507_43860 [Mycobacterium marinum]